MRRGLEKRSCTSSIVAIPLTVIPALSRDPPYLVRREKKKRWTPGQARGDENYSASAPEIISTNSVVMAAWRWRLYLIESLLIMSPALRVALSIAVICDP